MRRDRWRIHALLRCVDCGKEWGMYATAQANALRHARKAEHTVRGEAGCAVVYDGRPSLSPSPEEG